MLSRTSLSPQAQRIQILDLSVSNRHKNSIKKKQVDMYTYIQTHADHTVQIPIIDLTNIFSPSTLESTAFTTQSLLDYTRKSSNFIENCYSSL